MFLVDSHCHLDILDLTADNGKVDNVIARATENGVRHFLNVAVNLANFPSVLQTAENYPFVSASVGSHPNEQNEKVTEEHLIQLGKAKKVVAVGETGLDYYRLTGDMTWQQEKFRVHIRAAKALKKPLIVHTRAAKEDTLRILMEEEAHTIGGVMHCFSEDFATAKYAMDMNFLISFSGIVTFKNAESIREVAKQIPLDRLLIETDSPYLAPDPFRGKPNEPAYMKYTAIQLAQLHQIATEKLAEATTNNFFHLFKGAEKNNV